MNEKYALELLAGPTAEPVTLDEAREWLRGPEEVDNGLIETLITSARTYFEEHDDRRLITQTYRMTLDRFPIGEIEIPLRPVQAIDRIQYVDDDGVQQTLSTALYQADLNAFRVKVKPAYDQFWPTTRFGVYGAVAVEFVVGYEAAIPEHLKKALLLHIGHLYENREETQVAAGMMSLPMGYWSLIGANRALNV